MRFNTIAFVTALLCSFSSALNITYPTTGARIDRSQPFNITWNVTNDDPFKDDSIDILIRFSSNDLLQYVAKNVSVSALKYNVPSNKLDAVGSAIFIMNTIGTQGNAFTASVVSFILGSAANTTETASPSSAMTSTSSSAGAIVGTDLNAGVFSAFVAWLASTGLGMLI